MDSAVLIVIALAGVFVGVILLVLPTNLRYLATAAVLFINPAGAFFGVALTALWGVVAGLGSLREVGRLVSRGLAPVLLAIAVTQFMAIMWSPDPSQAVTAGLATLTLLFCLAMCAFLITSGRTKQLVDALIVMGPLVIVQAVSVVVFRLSPSVEEAYYKSGLSSLLLGSAGRDLYTGGVNANNVLDLDRAGGLLFVNCNRATMVMGVCLLLYFAIGFLFRRRFAFVIVFFLAGGIVAANSKTGLVLLLVLPLIAFFIGAASGRVDPARVLGVTVVALVLGGVVIQAFLSFGDDFISASEETLVPRFALWSEAVRAIGDSPLIGLGFGGWLERWQQGDVVLYFQRLPRPPHNVFLSAWLDGGVGVVVLAVIFGVVVLVCTFRALSAMSTTRSRTGVAMLFGMFLWVLIHGLGDNTYIFGTIQTVPLLGAALALLLSAPRLLADESNEIVPLAEASGRARS